MEQTTTSLTKSVYWERLLQIARNKIGKNASFYEPIEQEQLDLLLDEYGDNLFDLGRQVEAILESEELKTSEDGWANFKVAATILYHLESKGNTPGDGWQNMINILWRVLGEIGKGKWSDFAGGDGSETIPKAWKKIKFAVDALLFTIGKLNINDDGRIERFFNSSMSTYWKAYKILGAQVWGKYQEDREAYFKSEDYRNNHKLATYRLFIYKLDHFKKEFEAHPHKHKDAYNFLKDHPDRIPTERNIRKDLYYALMRYLLESDENHTHIGCIEIIKKILGKDDTFEILMDHTDLESNERGRLLLSFDDLEDRWQVSNTIQLKILPDLLKALSHDELAVRERAARFLEPHRDDLFKFLRYMEGEGDGTEVFKKIIRVYRDDAAKFLLENISFTPLEKGKFLLAAPRTLESCWESSHYPSHQDLLPIIMAVVEHGEGTIRKEANDFLKRKSTVIQKQLDDLINSLEHNEDKASEMIASAIKFGSDAALKAILEKCTVWVASEQNGTLVDRAAQKARQTPGAVLALVNLLNNRMDLHKSQDVKDFVRWRVLEEQQSPTIKRVFEDEKLTDNELDHHTIEEIYKWCYSQKERSKAYVDLVASQEEAIRKKDSSLIPRATFNLAQAVLKLMEQEEMKERELVVQKWITQLLSEMSDSWFFEGERDLYNEIKKQLERLAIEPLSKRLPKEENVDIRENLVKILGNIGGRVAVDALVRTVTGEERERIARQELLSEYYLKPSKARSEEASILLNDAVENAKKTMRLLQSLNIATFALGVILIMGGVIISIVSQELGGRVTGVLAGLGGLAAILTQFLKDPLERIQRAMADLVQVQTAFTSFVWELNLNGTYIQSQYVSEGILTDFDLRQTIGRIDQAMERTMHLIQIYADSTDLGLPPQLHYLIPSNDRAGLSLTLMGQCLRGNKTNKEKSHLAINHQPIETTAQVWTDNHATFSFDKSLLKKYQDNPRIWVSLIINGKETNALPYLIEMEMSKKEEKPKMIDKPKVAEKGEAVEKKKA